MIYAIPHSRECVANHFMKAKQFAFLDENSAFINNTINPGASNNASCSDKKAIVTLIKEMKTDAVIVRNIGERALDKLLKLGIRVFQINCQIPVSQALNSPMVELTDAKQGRPSKNHQTKGGCSGHSGGCCGHKDESQLHRHQHQHASSGNKLGKKRAMFSQMNAISSLNPLQKQ